MLSIFKGKKVASFFLIMSFGQFIICSYFF